METLTIDGLTLFFDAEEHDTAELAQDACEKSIQIIKEQWGLETPPEVRVYIMTSWLRFIFHSAPWYWQPLLVLSAPFWYFRVRNLWQYAGGWAQSYGKRRAIGVKPPRLIRLAKRGMGDRIFVRENTIDEKVRHITCHELTHAFTAHLRLPMWLNEGLAMLSVDRLLGKATVKTATLAALARSASSSTLSQVSTITEKNQDAVIYLYVRGYWVTRYLENVQPGLIKNLLTQPYSHAGLESKIATALDMDRETFWSSIDDMVVDHFSS
ncbi:MAG: hypothetical protein JXB07_08465 [Anaerolineae bacterium]|nr:hypothetical protein [Anaerolineae bacterium]